jgi:hypothetical protein
MRSSTTPDFWASYRLLPPEIQDRAKVAYRLWRTNPRHPSLRFKKVGDVWSLRIGSGYRAMALLEEDTFFWFWIGTHDEYERVVSSG